MPAGVGRRVHVTRGRGREPPSGRGVAWLCRGGRRAGAGVAARVRRWACALAGAGAGGRMVWRRVSGAGGRADGVAGRAGCGAVWPPPRMVGCVGCFWALLSWLLVAVCSFSCLSPAWIVQERGGGGGGGGRRLALALGGPQSGGGGGEVSFGLLWHCGRPWRHVRDCYAFGGLARFGDIPSGSWQVSGARGPRLGHLGEARAATWSRGLGVRLEARPDGLRPCQRGGVVRSCTGGVNSGVQMAPGG